MSDGLEELRTGGRLLVISPHLDDAVLSCGGLIEFARDPFVLTIFAGDAPLGASALEWDRQCGFEPGMNVMDNRRTEDAQALRSLGAAPVWGTELQEGYRIEPPDERRLTALITETFRELAPTHLLVPLGLEHPDHKIVSATGVAAARESGVWYAILYADKPYAQRHPGAVRDRLNALRSEGADLSPIPVPRRARHPRRSAIECYESQLRGLRISALRVAFYKERYWRMVFPPT